MYQHECTFNAIPITNSSPCHLVQNVVMVTYYNFKPCKVQKIFNCWVTVCTKVFNEMIIKCKVLKLHTWLECKSGRSIRTWTYILGLNGCRDTWLVLITYTHEAKYEQRRECENAKQSWRLIPEINKWTTPWHKTYISLIVY